MTSSETLTAEFVKSHSRRVSDVMTHDVIVARPDTPLHEVATLLEHNRIKRVPIVQDGKIVGVVSRANLVQAIASWRDEFPASVPNDAALRQAVMANLEKESWAPTGLINVTARAGRIDVWGFVDSEAQKEAIRVAIEITPGVTAVNNNLTIRPIMAQM
jgi:predicted transcriptional regulator